MKLFSCFAVASLLSVLLAGGCARVGTQSATTSGNPWTHHGVLRVVNIQEPDTLDPVVGAEQIDADLAFLWGGFFFDWSDRNEFVPDLATEMPTLRNGGISPDGKTVVYHLRRGVRWHDGAPFSADDVIFTWRAIMNKNNNVSSTVGYDLITAIDKRDDYTVAVHLRHAYAPFIATFFAPSANPYPVLPAHLLAKYPNINQVSFNSQPVGTGPFEVERWQRGNKIVFRANPHYWRGHPKLDRIWYTPVPDENTIVTLLQSHEADLEFYGSAQNYEQLSHIRGTSVALTPFTQYSQLAINVSTRALSDVRVRRALWHAIDVAGLIRNVTHDADTPGYTDQPAFLWAFNPHTVHYDYDPAQARALLDAAGWKVGPGGIRTKGGQRLSLLLAGVSGVAANNAVNVIVQRDFRNIGVDLQIKTYVSSLFFASYGAGGIVQNSKFDLAFFSWSNGTDPDDSVNWMCDQFPPNGQNVYKFCDHALDRQERIALTSNDRAERKKAYDAIQSILADRVPAIITWYVRRISVYNTDLKNYRPAHAVTTFWNSYDWQI